MPLPQLNEYPAVPPLTAKFTEPLLAELQFTFVTFGVILTADGAVIVTLAVVVQLPLSVTVTL